jgi:SAM-dependent methyltransferase
MLSRRAAKVQEWALSRILETLDVAGATVEIGCGGGAFTRALAAQGAVFRCADVGCWHEPIPRVPHTSGADLLGRLPFGDGAFRSVIALEVMEHMMNPFGALAEMARILVRGGRLYLTFPNFWGIRARWRFMWRGSLNRSHTRDPAALASLREGRCPPHINTMPWPTLKYALLAYGFEVEELCGYQRHPGHDLALLPLALPIQLATLLARASQRDRFELDETNRWSVLFGSHHVFLRARRVGAGEDHLDSRSSAASPWV